MKYDINIDSFIGYPISKGYIRSLLRNKTGKPVTVRINSFGGDVQHALDIRQQFVDHGDVTVYIYGMTASAATILAMGAKKIVMSKYATVMVHNCAGWVDTWGSMNAQQIADAIRNLSAVKDQLEKVDEIIANVYADRSKTDMKKIVEVMAKGEWLNAEECKALGLADEITEEGKQVELTDKVKETLTACGLPVPEDSAAGNSAEAQEPGSLDTVCRSFIDNVMRFFGMEARAHREAAAQENEDGGEGGAQDAAGSQEKNNKPVNIIDMKKYKALGAVEGISGMTVSADGSVSFTAENLEKVDRHISALEARVKDLERENREKDEQIAALGKKDGAETGQVHGEGEKAESFEDIYNSVQKYVH